MLSLGYARPLEAPDLYKLPNSFESAYIGNQIVASFERRVQRAAEYNTRLANGEISAGWRVVWWTLRGHRADREKKWREKDGKQRASLVWAMNDSVKRRFWFGGALKILGDTAQVTSPLIVKVCLSLFPGQCLLCFQGYHHFRHRVLFCTPNRDWQNSTGWPWYRPYLCASGSTGSCIPVYPPLLLSFCFHRCPFARRIDHCYIRSVSSADIPCAFNPYQRAYHEPHLHGRIENRLLRWVLSYGLFSVLPASFIPDC